MTVRHSKAVVPAISALFLGLLAASPADAASGWLAAAGSAGFAVDGDFSGLHFSCRNAGLPRLVFGPFSGTFDAGHSHTVIVDVDGTAFRLETRAEEDGASGGTVFVRSRPIGEFAGLIAALKAGKAAEVSAPSGRFALPLRGSGKALAVLDQSCE